MTQDKMRRIITACISAATVLLVFLLGWLIYQWIDLTVTQNKIDKIEKEITALEQQIAMAEEDAEYYNGTFYLQWKLDELEQKKDLIEGK